MGGKGGGGGEGPLSNWTGEPEVRGEERVEWSILLPLHLVQHNTWKQRSPKPKGDPTTSTATNTLTQGGTSHSEVLSKVKDINLFSFPDID